MLGLSSSVWGGPANIPISATGGVRVTQGYPSNIVDVIVNATRAFSDGLSSEDKETHIETVLFAMQNADNGEVVQWHNTKEKTSGYIKIVLTRPAQGGYCREFFTRINKNGSYKDYHESGCRTIDSQFWTFSGQ